MTARLPRTATVGVLALTCAIALTGPLTAAAEDNRGGPVSFGWTAYEPLARAVTSGRLPVHIDTVRYDPAGSDTGSNAHLNKEVVVIENRSGKARVLTGWTLRDTAGHVYTFPATKLKSGRSVTVHTGKGNNRAGHRYWGAGAYVWNNDGDKAILRNKSGASVDTCSWNDADGTTSC